MQTLIYCPPIPVSDLDFIQQVLEREDVFSSCFTSDDLNKYNYVSFHKEKDLHGTETYVLLDRNVFTYIISIAKGEDVDLRDKQKMGPRRIAAAIMAYLQCSDICIEPNIALYEYAATNTQSTATDELELFRKADNLHPQIYADIALGRKNKVTTKELDKASGYLGPMVNFRKDLNHWHFNYTVALKLALLELQLIQQNKKMESFLQWQHDDFFYGAPVTLFASLYLSSKRIGGMMKKLRSIDRTKALLGIKNAAWDLTVLTTWSKSALRMRETNKLWLLCSRDTAMKKIAGCLFTTEIDENIVSLRLKSIFIEHWGKDLGISLYNRYFKFKDKNLDDSRHANKKLPNTHWENLRNNLEKDFLERKN